MTSCSLSLKEKLEANTQLTKTETQKEYQEQLNQKDLEISKLNAKLRSEEHTSELQSPC